jgi:SAM-dependent methyltransferase
MMGYGDDLAYIHDAGHDRFIRDAAPFLLQCVRKATPNGSLVVDLGCGSGIWAKTLVEAGYKVLGIDQSASMTAIARARVPAAEFRTQSFLDAKLPPCGAVTAIGEIFGYLLDGRNTERRLVAFLRRVYDALALGGCLVFDVASPGRVRGPGPQSGHREGADWAVLVTSAEDKKRQLLTRRITSFRKVGELYRRDYEVHRLRLYRFAELAAPLRQMGFRVRRLAGYGKQPFLRGHIGLLARKT